ncbi:MAG: hypothetical protein JOZ05_11575 [Acetobacteraceae bacterium]|nr:hypothetical protein [Acetobacteraceae bacterium]
MRATVSKDGHTHGAGFHPSRRPLRGLLRMTAVFVSRPIWFTGSPAFAGDDDGFAYTRLVVNTASAAIDAAIAGFGITRVLSYQVADAIRAGTLAVVLEKI